MVAAVTAAPACVAGDATRPEPYTAALQGKAADLLLTDPPYCLLTRRRKGGDLRDKRPRKIDREEVVRFESVRDYRTFTEAWLPRAVAHLTPQAPLVIWTNLLGKPPILEAAAGLGYQHLRGEFVWAKRTREVNANEQLLRVYEVALVITREPAPPPTPDERPLPWSVVTAYADPGEDPEIAAHPHHKPFSALAPLVLSWSRPGARVLDPFAGSGSIPVAAMRLGRTPCCIELREDWAPKITARLARVRAPSAS
jgi:site-specific DNA-methyltransferase (adenine-specific)